MFGSQHIHVSIFHSHNSQLTILNSIHNSLSFSFSFFFLILTQILVWNPNFELSFWFVKSKLNKTQTMGTMSKRLPNTHISSTHKPNKEKKKAKVKREREKNEERICVVSNQKFHHAPFLTLFQKWRRKLCEISLFYYFIFISYYKLLFIFSS